MQRSQSGSFTVALALPISYYDARRDVIAWFERVVLLVIAETANPVLGTILLVPIFNISANCVFLVVHGLRAFLSPPHWNKRRVVHPLGSVGTFRSVNAVGLQGQVDAFGLDGVSYTVLFDLDRVRR